MLNFSLLFNFQPETLNFENNNIPLYLSPILAMVCQGFILMNIVLFIFDKSYAEQNLSLEKETGAQIAYFLIFQAASLLLYRHY